MFEKSQSPVISICITTFNISSYLHQCLDSALAQQVSVPIEIVIVDDCSTDETPAIIRQYQAKYQEIIKAYFNFENLKYARNYLKALQLCDGEYIAILDGDDYWTEPMKLQHQLDFMKLNPEFTMCHHNGWISEKEKESQLFGKKKKPDAYGLEWLLHDAGNWNSSVMYRNIFKGKFPGWLSNALQTDYPLHILHAARGRIKYMDEPWGVYRRHSGNISLMKSRIDNERLYFNSIWVSKKLLSAIPRQFHGDVKLIIARHYDLLAGLGWKNNEYMNFIKYLCLGYLVCPIRSIKEYKDSWYHLFRQK